MPDDSLYLPKVLFTEKPALRSPLNGRGIRGEVLLYPFLDGALIILSAARLPDVPCTVYISRTEPQSFVPCGGFIYAVYYAAAPSAEELFSTDVSLTFEGEIICSGKFAVF